MKVYISSGGGVRIGGSFGAVHAGEMAGKFNGKDFDWYAGTSAGAFDAVLTANGWTGKQKMRLFSDTNFGSFFTLPFVPFGLRKGLVGLNMPLSMKKLQKFYLSLTELNDYGPPLEKFDRVLINSVDTKENMHVVYCESIPPFVTACQGADGNWYSHQNRIRWEMQAFTRVDLGLDVVLCNSQALPGLRAPIEQMADGGIAQNPLLSIFPKECSILMLNLGFAGRVEKLGKDFPINVLDESLYAYEFRAHEATLDLIEKFPGLQCIYPGIFDIESSNFALSKQDKINMCNAGARNAVPQWKMLVS